MNPNIISTANLESIILKDGKPVIVTKDILIDFIQDDSAYAPIIITCELLDKIGFDKTINPVNKDVYYGIGDSNARVIFDNGRRDFRLNFNYSIKSTNRETKSSLYFTSLNQLQFYLEIFYGIKIKPEVLLKLMED